MRPITVAVVGSLNMDFVVPVPHHPSPGETVLGGDHLRTPGGKGANQAVAAARLGQRVAMIGRVGDDALGVELLDALVAEGIDTTHVSRADAPTGLALITVDTNGENSIAVSPGANGRMQASDVTAAAPVLSEAAVVLLSLEIPLEVVRAAAHEARGVLVLNPAPARQLPDELLQRCDVVVPNRVELAELVGAAPPDELDDVAALATSLCACSTVVVTLGAQGALLCSEAGTVHIPSAPAQAVDTTGAGDAFCGGLVDALARGADVESAARWASRVAACAVERTGAQAAMPRRDQVE